MIEDAAGEKNSVVIERAAWNKGTGDVLGSRWEGLTRLTKSTWMQRVGCPGVTSQKFLKWSSI